MATCDCALVSHREIILQYDFSIFTKLNPGAGREKWFKVQALYCATMGQDRLFQLIRENVDSKFEPIQVILLFFYILLDVS